MNKKIFALCLVLTMILGLSLSGCGGSLHETGDKDGISSAHGQI